MSQRRQFRPLATETLEDRVVLSLAAAAPHAVVALQAFPAGSFRAQNLAYVESLFAFVGRTPAVGGVDYHERQLSSGRQNRFQIAQSFVNTPEFRNSETRALFGLLLDRAPTQAELQFYGRSHSLAQTTVQILGTQEYFNAAGGTNQGFVTRLYNDVLGRATDPGAQGWVNALNNGASRQNIASQILQSSEGVSNVVALAFGQVLNRAPGVDGAAYVRNLSHGGSAENVFASLLASQEYYNRTQVGAPVA